MLMPELLIRPTHGDHLVLEDLLAPSPLSARRSIDRIVLCAHDAARDERLLEAARKSGAPLLVDPLTMLLQDPVDPDDPWVRLLPFGRAEALHTEELSSPFVLDEIHAVPNAVHGLIMEARARGWSISYSRTQRREQYGSIRLAHPTDSAHDCSIELPLPDDPATHRQLESEIGMRIRWTQAA